MTITTEENGSVTCKSENTYNTSNSGEGNTVVVQVLGTHNTANIHVPPLDRNWKDKTTVKKIFHIDSNSSLKVRVQFGNDQDYSWTNYGCDADRKKPAHKEEVIVVGEYDTVLVTSHFACGNSSVQRLTRSKKEAVYYMKPGWHFELKNFEIIGEDVIVNHGYFRTFSKADNSEHLIVEGQEHLFPHKAASNHDFV